MATEAGPFRLQEATITEMHVAFLAREVSVRELVRLYINRIEAFDKEGPRINSIITVNPNVFEEADRLDAICQSSSDLGLLHGVAVVLKDQIDALGMPTTLGSILFKDYFPSRDAFVVDRLKRAGALILGKATLGELGMGDAHGSLFGSTRNPYDLERTVGGSSGGSAAAVAANLGAVGIGQEFLASIRRPAAWNAVVGMRPTAGLISRSGVYAGWPGTVATLGPLTRSVTDQAHLLDAMVGYDPDDPITALGIGHSPTSYTTSLDIDGLKGARVGILREPIGSGSEPTSEDFRRVDEVFDQAVREIAGAGADVLDPVVIPRLNELMAKRAGGGGATNPTDAWDIYFARGKNPPFHSPEEMTQSPEFEKVHRGPSVARSISVTASTEYLQAREELMIGFLKVMADHRLDVIVHKSVEHQPTLITEGIKPPFVNTKGATSLNSFLNFVPAISVPAGFTRAGLPTGITLMGRPYADATVLKLAYAYEQATHHRQAPSSTPPLAGEP